MRGGITSIQEWAIHLLAESKLPGTKHVDRVFGVELDGPDPLIYYVTKHPKDEDGVETARTALLAIRDDDTVRIRKVLKGWPVPAEPAIEGATT